MKQTQFVMTLGTTIVDYFTVKLCFLFILTCKESARRQQPTTSLLDGISSRCPMEKKEERKNQDLRAHFPPASHHHRHPEHSRSLAVDHQDTRDESTGRRQLVHARGQSQ